jgi:hypothetical protein
MENVTTLRLSIENGVTVAISDGSCKDQSGTFALVIEEDKTILVVYYWVMGDPNEQSASRSEMHYNSSCHT